MRQERRSFERVPLAAPIRYQQKGLQGFGNLIGRDISDSGIGFVSNKFLPISTHLILEVQHPKSLKFIRAVGEVVWISGQPYSERFSVGTKFIEPPTAI